MKADKLLNECLANIPNDITIEIDLSFDIANRIDTILSNRNISQKDFAAIMGKKESEVSKWLKGTHNFTLRTIAKITDALNEPIVEVVGKRKVIKEYVYIPLISTNMECFSVQKSSKRSTYTFTPSKNLTYAAIN